MKRPPIKTSVYDPALAAAFGDVTEALGKGKPVVIQIGRNDPVSAEEGAANVKAWQKATAERKSR